MTERVGINGTSRKREEGDIDARAYAAALAAIHREVKPCGRAVAQRSGAHAGRSFTRLLHGVARRAALRVVTGAQTPEEAAEIHRAADTLERCARDLAPYARALPQLRAVERAELAAMRAERDAAFEAAAAALRARDEADACAEGWHRQYQDTLTELAIARATVAHLCAERSARAVRDIEAASQRRAA